MQLDADGESASAGRAGVRARGVARQAALTVADQATTSGANFLTILFLARWMVPAAFGEFALAYAALLLIKNFHLALVTTPLMTIGGALIGKRFRDYRTTLLRIHVGCTVGALALIALGALALSAFRRGGAWGPLVVPVAAAAAALLWQEFVRRSLFAEQRRGAALVNDIVRYGTQLGGLGWLAATERLTPPNAFFAIAIGAALAGTLGIRSILPERGINRRERDLWLAETWDYGKWLAGHYTGVWVIERWYLLALAAMLTTTEVGVVAACAALLSISNVFYLSFENYAIPVFARRLAVDGSANVRRLFWRLLAMGAFPTTVCCVLVALFAESVLELLYGTRYAGYGWFLGLTALQAFVGYFARFAAIGLKILRRTREIFWAYAGVAMLTIAVSGPLISRFGLAGAGIGIVLTQVALAAPLLFWLFARPLGRSVDLATCENGT